MFKILKADFDHYRRVLGKKYQTLILIPIIIIWHPASVAVIWFRFGQAVQKIKFYIFRKVLLGIYFLIYPFIRFFSGVQIPLSASIGPGLAILHYGVVTMSSGTTIGTNCLLHYNVAIVGYRIGSGPTIGDNFYAGVSVTIVDDVIIGNNVTAGSGTVITKSVPENAIIAGVPAKILRFREPNEQPSENKTLKHQEPKWLKVSGKP